MAFGQCLFVLPLSGFSQVVELAPHFQIYILMVTNNYSCIQLNKPKPILRHTVVMSVSKRRIFRPAYRTGKLLFDYEQTATDLSYNALL